MEKKSEKRVEESDIDKKDGQEGLTRLSLSRLLAALHILARRSHPICCSSRCGAPARPKGLEAGRVSGGRGRWGHHASHATRYAPHTAGRDSAGKARSRRCC